MATIDSIRCILTPLGNDPLVDPDCEEEIYDIVAKSGLIVKFRADYKARLKVLLEYRELAWQAHNQWFERLKYVDEASLYSMHLASIGNMRIIYAVGRNIILLCAFKEKGEHGKARESYKQYIPVAEKRLERYKEV